MTRTMVGFENMKKSISTISVVAVLAFAAGYAASAQTESTPKSLDAVAAAPKNHKVLYEDSHIRVLEVTVQPGERENMHEHKYPSVFAADATFASYTDYLADGNIRQIGRNVELKSAKVQPPEALVQAYAGINARLNSDLANGLPVSWVAPPEAAHQVVNTDSFPFHFYRIEFKRVEGAEIMKKKLYP